MKGFVRILEAVISSFIILASLSYFFSAPAKYDYWGETFSRIQAQDALASLYKNGSLTEYVQNNDVDGLNNSLTAMLPETMAFSVEIVGIPNPIIYMGCSCIDDEVNDLKSILDPLLFSYDNRQIEIRIEKQSTDNIDPRTNIHFICGYKNLKSYEGEINEFLQNGGTIFMLSNLSEVQVINGVMNETFGLKWGSGTGSSTGEFYNSDDVSKISHKIKNYFLGIGGDDTNPFTFNFDSALENKIAIDEKSIIKHVDVSLSHVKVNKLIHGRTVWFADYDNSDDNVNNLLKAVILWASGESYRLDPEYKDSVIERLKNSEIPYTEASYLIPNYEVKLKIWGIFY